MYLTVNLRLRDSTSWADAGHEIAWFQQQISTAEPAVTSPLSRLNSILKLSAETRGVEVRVAGHGFSFVFDKARGYLNSWVAGGVSLLEKDPLTKAAIIPSFWRPPTDNDVSNSLIYWERFGVDSMTSQLRSFETRATTETVEVIATTFLSPPVLNWGYEATTKYTISPVGALSIAVSLKPMGKKPDHVPRIGLNLRLPRTLDAVRWHGLGPGESYPDKAAAQRVGVWDGSSVADLQTPYDVPQENGNRMQTRWLQLSAPHGQGIRVVAGKPADWSHEADRRFSFVASHHSAAALQKAAHPCDLVEEDATFLRLDAKVAGVGTGACGPRVREDLMVQVEELKFAFVLEATGGL